MPLKGQSKRRVIGMRRWKLVTATLLVVASVAAPLFAGYCMNCYSYQCETGCSPVYSGYWTSYCVACQMPDGSFACTACNWLIYWCMRGQYACANPPYIYVLTYAEDKWRPDPPFSCVWTDQGYRCQ
jgi:hypothetical protein